MTSVRHGLAQYLLLCAAAIFSAVAHGTSLQELQASGHLKINSSLKPDSGIVPGQRVELTLETITDTWFTGGTRISIPEVPGLVILQTEQFASNASETRHGQSWVIQRWTLDVFPQRAGDFTIDGVTLQIQINAGEDGNVAGEVRSPPQHFSVAIPESLAEVKHWVAAPQFRVSQSFNHSLKGLTVGDAFEHEVRFEASDVLAMMLPDYDAAQQPGLAAYPFAPTLDNSSNRGQNLASRTERTSYVVEQPGQYLLPAQEYYWWNTQSGKLELLSLPETHIEVTGAAVSEQPTTTRLSISPQQWLLLGAGLALLLGAVLLARRLLRKLPIARWRELLSQQLHRLRALFKPALATKLNPGSSSEE
ncbi:Uncharacterised protein [Halioglobus japonicus]|nr:Uncharacterised protein [Halioglobus japonicus]